MLTRTTLQEYMRFAADLVEAELDTLTDAARSHPAAPPRLLEAMRYSLLGGGKRLRPLLALAAAELCGAPARQALPAACAVEMIHCYSLIHDDLPAMDDDDLRRGRPTSHKMFGEAMAILAGDALLTLAFQVLAAAAADPKVGPDRAARAVQELAVAAGPEGMAGGQVLDLAAEGRAIDPAELAAIHGLKTGALFTASLRLGALLAGGGQRELDLLTAYGRHFGLAFQICDDVLDVTGDTAKLGKPVGSDARHDKATYVKFYGLEEARRRARAQAVAAAGALAPLGERAAILQALAHFIVDRES